MESILLLSPLGSFSVATDCLIGHTVLQFTGYHWEFKIIFISFPRKRRNFIFPETESTFTLSEAIFPETKSTFTLSEAISHALIHSSVQFSRSVMCDSLQLHGWQHNRSPCPSPTPGAYSNSCPSSQWCHPTVSSSVVSFSFCLQFFPASGSSQMSQLFPSDGQSIGVSASASVLPMNIQDWFALG